MEQDRDPTTPNHAANKSKAEGERWGSEENTVERRERARTSNEGEGGGITNRPLKEENANQDALPDRGQSQGGAHAGHGDRDRSRNPKEG